MKRALILILLATLCLAQGGAANAETAVVDMDLSALNRAITYAQMLQVARDPEAFEGRVFRLNGKFNYAPASGRAKIIVSDNAGCCELSMIFVPAETLAYPDDYPPLYADLTITGRLTVDPADPELPVYFADASVEWKK